MPTADDPVGNELVGEALVPPMSISAAEREKKMSAKMTHTKITQGLLEVGACWAISDKKFIVVNDGFDAKASYHVHPDATMPRQNDICKFSNLNEIADFIHAKKAVKAAKTPEGAEAIWQRYLNS